MNTDFFDSDIYNISTKGSHFLATGTKNRNADIDVIKFLSACMIMLCHISLFFDTYSQDVPFSSGAIFNQLFFIITGYFTAKHFWGRGFIKPDHQAKESVFYVIKKLKPAFIYSGVCVLILYAYKIIVHVVETGSFSISFLFDSVEQAIYDALYMRSIGYLETDYGTLWYLSALLFVLPIVCVLLQSRILKQYYIYLFSWIIPFVYFGFVKYQGISEPPHRMLYAFSALSLGVFVYWLTKKVDKINVGRRMAVLLTVFKWGLFFLFAFLCRINIGNSFLYNVVFIFIAVVSFTDLTYHLPSNSFTTFLGNDLSLVLYVSHFVVYRIVASVFASLSAQNKTIIGITLSFVVSIIFVCMSKQIINLKKRRKSISN